MPKVKNIAVVVGLALAGVGLGVLYTFDPATTSFYPRCVFRALTGLLCAGCGATRAAHQLLHGQFEEALRLNAVFVLTGPFLLAGAALEGRAAMRGETLTFMCRPWLGWTALAVLIGWGVLRNVFGV